MSWPLLFAVVYVVKLTRMKSLPRTKGMPSEKSYSFTRKRDILIFSDEYLIIIIAL